MDARTKRQESFLKLDAERADRERRIRKIKADHAAAEKRIGRKAYQATDVYRQRQWDIARLTRAVSEREVMMFGTDL
jgi:hypothetical protein